MQIPFDYKDLLRILNKHRVKYLIIGAYAVVYYTEPRYTKDLDIWVEPSLKNAEKVYRALKEFGAPLQDVRVEDFTNPDLVYQIGVAPVRVDIIMSPAKIEFKEAWKNRKRVNLIEGVKVNIIGLDELIKMKKMAKRDTDKRDLKALLYIRKKLKKKKGEPKKWKSKKK